jgi:alpha-tubulin suppressor-like RCC1 family protein
MLDSTVYCWGSNASGSLGTGNATFSYGPQLVQMPSTFTPPEMVSTGDDATCLITQGSGLLCWGRNNSGKLGNGTSHDAVPPTTTSVYGATSVATGQNHVCTLSSDVVCWGYNAAGQLGTGGWEEAVWEPVVTGAGSGAPLYVRAGGFNTCTVRDDGSLWCSGNNFEGQTGNGTTVGGHVYTPIQVIGLDEGVIDATVAGDFACAVTTGAGLKCWGKNTVGQLGLGFTSANVTYPTEVTIGAPVVAASGGRDHACAVDSNGSVWCWGGNAYGQLGDGTTNARSTPALVGGLTDVTKVVAGNFATCALDGSSNVYCWGDSITTGQPVYGDKLTPQLIAGHQAIDIELGFQHACLISTEGNVHCWGASSNYELGIMPGAAIAETPQAAVPVGAPVTAISLGAAFTCAVTSEQKVVCWGENDYGQINDTTTWLPNSVLEMYDDIGGY